MKPSYDRSLDKRNFRKKILLMNLLIDTGAVEQGVSHRAAKLYKFDESKYLQLRQDGFNFEIWIIISDRKGRITDTI